jgi:hypothetical protein
MNSAKHRDGIYSLVASNLTDVEMWVEKQLMDFNMKKQQLIISLKTKKYCSTIKFLV